LSQPKPPGCVPLKMSGSIAPGVAPTSVDSCSAIGYSPHGALAGVPGGVTVGVRVLVAVGLGVGLVVPVGPGVGVLVAAGVSVAEGLAALLKPKSSVAVVLALAVTDRLSGWKPSGAAVTCQTRSVSFGPSGTLVSV